MSMRKEPSGVDEEGKPPWVTLDRECALWRKSFPSFSERTLDRLGTGVTVFWNFMVMPQN